MLSEFITEKLDEANYKLLKDGSYFGEISGLQGVWANAKNLENCRRELQQVLEEWLILKIRDREVIAGFSSRLADRRLRKHA